MKIFVLLFFGFLSAPLFGEDHSKITVSGKGSVRVVPDQVSITVGFVTRDKDAQVAKNTSDKVMRNIIDAAKKNKIADKDIQSDYTQIELENFYNNTGNDPKVFIARRSLRVLLRKIDQFDILTAALFTAGANNLSSVEFNHSKEDDYRVRSKVLAIKYAKETAELLAKEAGLTLGVAKSIDLGGSIRQYALYKASTAGMDAASSASTSPSISQGEVEISTELNVTYEAK